MILKDPMLWRIFWKEYRAQRSFWVVIAGFGIGLMLLLAVLLDASPGRFVIPWVIALGLPTLYALGCGAILFASEQEEGTAEFLRIMAVRTSCLFAAKIAFSVISTLTLAGLLVGAARIVTWGERVNLVYGNEHAALYSLWITISLLVWATFFSTVCRKVLVAVCLSAAGPLIVRAVTQWLPWNEPGQELNLWLKELALSVPVLLGASYILLRRRMAESHVELSWPRGVWPGRTRKSALDRLAAKRETAPDWRRQFVRLVWLERRHVFSLGHVLWIAAILLCSLAAGIVEHRLHVQHAMGGIVILSALAGVWSFQAEGGRRTRFLAEQGVSPLAVWLSKQLVWIGLAVALILPFLLIGFDSEPPWQSSRPRNLSIFDRDLSGTSAMLFAVGLGSLAYAVGQLASMLISRAVTAAFVTFAVLWLLALWAWLMFELHVPQWLSTLPLVVAMLAATLVWSRNWLLESASWRSWRRLALAGNMLLLLVWAGIGVFRILEVPSLDSVLQHRPDYVPVHLAGPTPATAEEIETARMYLRARSEYKWTKGRPWESDGLGKTARDGWESARDEERQLLAENQQALARALDATARSSCAFSDPSRPDFSTPNGDASDGYLELLNLILLSARQLESDGKLDEALERYIAGLRMARHVASRGAEYQWHTGAHLERVVGDWMPFWAGHPAQTPERIEAGARRVREELDRFPLLSEALQNQRAWMRHIIDLNWSEVLAESNRGASDLAGVAVSLVDRLCPWERYRARRLQDLISYVELSEAQAVENALATPGVDPAALLPSAAIQPIDQRIDQLLGGPRNRSEEAPWKWTATTFPWSLYAVHVESFVIHARLARALSARALLLRLALAAWKNAHGEYPADLEDLPEVGERMLIDPYSGQEFGYRPRGFPHEVQFGNPLNYHGEVVAADQPLIWSVGPYGIRIVPVRDRPDRTRFATVDSHGPIDATNRARYVGAYAFRLP
jgi:hypothetical protein